VRQNPDDRPLDDFGLDNDYEDDDPNNPTHRDHDLSTSANYDYDTWDTPKPWYLRRWLLLLVSLLIVASLVLSLILPFI
jgi:hypothetical protein